MNILIWMLLGGVIGGILAINTRMKNMTNFYVNIILGVAGILLGSKLLFALLQHKQSFNSPFLLTVLAVVIGLFYATYLWIQHSNNMSIHERR